MDVTLPKRVTEIGDFAFGATEQQKVNADGSTTDEMETIAVSGFLLTGYEEQQQSISVKAGAMVCGLTLSRWKFRGSGL